MKARKLLLGVLCAAAIAPPLPAAASLFRAYVASNGVVGNDCSLAHPCRYLADALSAVASGGEVWILDSANFNQGTVNIGKSVTILAVPGEVASIQALAGGPAIAIYTGGIDVTLRNVVITGNPLNPGTDGIAISASGSSVTVEKSVIANIAATAVYATGAVRVRVEDTTIRNAAGSGVRAEEGAVAEIADCALIGNGTAVYARAYASGTNTLIQVSDTAISGQLNSEGAFAMTLSPTAAAKVFVTRSTIFQTTWALDAEGNGTSVVEASASMVAANTYNVYISGLGVVRTFGNNHISGGGDFGVASSGALR